MIPDKQIEMEDIKSHKDKIRKINTLLDKLDERLACGEITESRYRELHDRYKSEAEKLKDHLTEQEIMHEVGLETEDDKEAEYRKEEPETEVIMQRNTKYCSNQQTKSKGLADFLSAIIPGLGQIYCGRGMRGVGFFILNIFLLFIFGSSSSYDPNSDGTGFLFLLVIIAWVWNILDARKIARTPQ